MEDRYLLKAKRIYNGEWVEGYLVETRHNTYHDGYRIIDKDGINYDELDYYEPSFISYVIDKTTICQCTGLKDKNGKLIWENDIVNAVSSNSVGEPICVDGIVVNVTDYNLMLNLYYSDELECVGNIFDNTELLESEG